MLVSDLSLMDRWIGESDGEAFAELVSRHSAMVYRTCLRILGDTGAAEDITQECFIKLAQARKANRDSLGGLLHTVATRLSLNRRRAESRRRRRERLFALNHARPAGIDWEDVSRKVDQAIEKLPEDQRCPIIDHFLQGQSHQAIAQTLGIDESTVRYRIKKGLEHIRTGLRRRGIPVDAVALAHLLETQLTEGASLPLAVAAELGKLAIAGRLGPAAQGAASGSAVGPSLSTLVGGTAVMWKQAAVILAIIALALGIPYGLKVKRERLDVSSARGEMAATAAPMVKQEPGTATGPPQGAGAEEGGRYSEDIGTSERPELPAEVWAALLERLQEAAQSTGGEEGQFPPRSSADIPPDNGAHYFLLATELMPDIDWALLDAKWQEVQANRFPEDPEFRAMLDKFRDSFDAIRTGLEVGNAEMPLPRTFSDDTEYLAKFRDLARVLTMQAEYFAGQGHYGTAFDGYTTVLEFANESANGGFLMSASVAFSIEETAAESLREVFAWREAPSEEYQLMIERLQNLDAQAYPVWESFDTTAVLINTLFDRALESGLGPHSLVETTSSETNEFLVSMTDEDLEALLRGTIQDFRAYVGYVASPYYEARSIGLDAITSDNPFAQLVVEPVAYSLLAQEARTRAQVRGTMLTAALELYSIENGAFPATLGELVPTFSPQLPEDPFSGRQFGYALTESGYILYSAGPDMNDDGGAPLGSEGAFEDLRGDLVIQSQ